MQTPENSYFIEVDDGWTLPGYLEAHPGRHGELRFTYRPCTVEERSTITAAIGRTTSNEEANRLVSKALASRIKSWSLSPEVAENNVSRLIPPIWDFLSNVIIFQTRGSDHDPKWDEADKSLHDDARLEAALIGKSHEAAKVDVLAKNSSEA